MCEYCKSKEIEWLDEFCQECWEEFCDNEYQKEIKILPIWCFEK